LSQADSRPAEQHEGELLLEGNGKTFRCGTIFIIGLGALIVGLLLPVPARIFDVLMVFSICLAIATLMISFSARQIGQVQGLPLLLVVTASLQMALAMVLSKMVLLQGEAGTLVGLLGRLVAGRDFVISVLVFGPITLFVFGLICAAVGFIARTGSDFLATAAVYKRGNDPEVTDADFISDTEANQFRSKLACACIFYAGMAVAGRFLLWASAVELVVTGFTVVAALSSQAAAGSTALAAPFYAGSALGGGIVFQLSSLVTALGSRALVRRGSIVFADQEQIGWQRGKRVKVAARQVDNDKCCGSDIGEGVDYIDADFDDESPPVVETDYAVAPADKDTEDLCVSTGGDVAGPVPELDRQNYYDSIASLIENLSPEDARTVLMGAERIRELPVTVPVNVAIRLARKGRCCLLVDLDYERAAVAKVFDLHRPGEPVEQSESAFQTCINNLWLWSASSAGKLGDPSCIAALKRIIASSANRYDHIVLYAPSIGTESQWKQLGSCVRTAIVFNAAGQARLGTGKILADYGCKVLAVPEAFAESPEL